MTIKRHLFGNYTKEMFRDYIRLSYNSFRFMVNVVGPFI